MTAQVAAKIVNREQWLADRRKGIGGSDVAAILGLNPWRSPFDVYLEKIDEAPPREVGEAAYWGGVLEDVVSREFAKRTGLKVQRRNALLQHPEHEFMVASLDREIVAKPRGVLEAKTTSAWNRDEWGDDKAPDAYVLQVMHYLAVTGYTYGYLAVLIGGNNFRMARVDRDEELIAYLIEREAEFWRRIETRTPPPVDGSAACTATIKALYSASERESVLLPLEAADVFREYCAGCADVKAAEARRDAAANEIKALMGDAEVGYLPGISKPVVTWKTVERKGYVVEPTTARTFRVSYKERED